MEPDSHTASVTASTLPQEALAALFLVLPIRDAGILRQICKRWAAIGASDEVWRRRTVAVWPALGERSAVTALLRSIPDRDELIPYHIVTDEHGEESPRLIWREIFFLAKRVSEIVHVLDSIIKPKCAAILASSASSRANGSSPLKAACIAAANFDSARISMKYSDIDNLLNLCETIQARFLQVRTVNMLPESGLPGAQVEQLKNDIEFLLPVPFFLLSLELCIQLAARRHFDKIVEALHRSSRAPICFYFKKSIDFNSSIPVVLSQSTRLLELAAGEIAESPYSDAALAAVSIIDKLRGALDDWIPYRGESIHFLLHFKEQDDVEKQLAARAVRRALTRFVHSCLQAFSVLFELEEVDEDPFATNAYFGQIEFVSTGRNALERVDDVMDCLFDDSKSSQIFFDIFLLAAQRFQEQEHEEEWRVLPAILRVIGILSRQCFEPIGAQFSLIMEKFILPASTSSVRDTRRAAAVCMSKLLSTGRTDLIRENQLPQLLSAFVPMLVRPEIGDFGRSCAINVWNELNKANHSPQAHGIKKVTDSIWDAIWPNFREICDAMCVPLGSEFYAPRIQARAAAIYSDLVVALLKRVSNDSGKFSHYSEKQRAQMHDEAVHTLTAVLPSFYISERMLRHCGVMPIAESIRDILGAVPPNMADHVSGQLLFAWLMTALRRAAQNARNVRSCVTASWSKDHDGEEGPAVFGSQTLERAVEADSMYPRDSILALFDIVKAAHKMDPAILEKFCSSSEWHSKEEILSDPIGAFFAVSVATLIMEKRPADSIAREYDTYVRFILDGCQSPSPFLAQASVRGLGVAAGVFPEKFQIEILLVALERLDAVWNFDPEEDAPFWKGVYECASSAYGKILSSCKGGLLSDLKLRAELFTRFYSLLPYTDDRDEIQPAARNLASLFEQQEPSIGQQLSDPEFGATMEQLLADPSLDDCEPALYAQLKALLDKHLGTHN